MVGAIEAGTLPAPGVAPGGLTLSLAAGQMWRFQLMRILTARLLPLDHYRAMGEA